MRFVLSEDVWNHVLYLLSQYFISRLGAIFYMEASLTDLRVKEIVGTLELRARAPLI